MKTIMVVGAGQMGAGIAQVSVQAGFKTIVCDASHEYLERGRKTIEKNLNRQVEKNKISGNDKDLIISRLFFTMNLEDGKNADIVIEAIPENEELKKKVFGELDEICPSHTILASNTSSLPITKLGAATKRADKVVGMHFMNPVPVMKLVEIIEGNVTSKETIQIIEKLADDFGKVIIKAKDYPGFLSTRLIMPFINEALYSVYEGRGTVEDIDKCAKLAFNHPMGPFEWIDFVGLDSLLSIFKVLFEAYGDSRYFPCPLLVQMVQAGRLGRKSGKGFYEYN